MNNYITLLALVFTARIIIPYKSLILENNRFNKVKNEDQVSKKPIDLLFIDRSIKAFKIFNELISFSISIGLIILVYMLFFSNNINNAMNILDNQVVLITFLFIISIELLYGIIIYFVLYRLSVVRKKAELNNAKQNVSAQRNF